MTEQPQQFPPTGLYLDDLVSAGKPSLGQFQIVDHLVRHYVKFILYLTADFKRGDARAKEPIPIIEEEARKLGAVFLGKDDRYDAQPWNNSSRLGALLRYQFQADTKHYGDPGMGAFMWLAGQVSAASQEQASGKPEAEVQKRLNACVEDFVAHLLGLR